jgi:hypothetical protein
MSLKHTSRAILFGLFALLFVFVLFGIIWLMARRPLIKTASATSQQSAPMRYSQLICDDAYQSEAPLGKRNPPYIDIELNAGCFGGWVTFPQKWRNWQYQMMGNNPDDWVAYWRHNVASPYGPFSANIMNTAHNLPDSDNPVRFQGHGMLRAYAVVRDQQGDEPPITVKIKVHNGKEPLPSGKDDLDSGDSTPASVPPIQ